MFGIGLYVVPVVLILFWSGLIAAGLKVHPSSWWWMASGTFLITLGYTSRLLIFVIGRNPNLPGWNEIYKGLMFCIEFLPLAGFLFFAMGFALRGSFYNRLRDRVTELELLSLAQATELERLRNR